MESLVNADFRFDETTDSDSTGLLHLITSPLGMHSAFLLEYVTKVTPGYLAHEITSEIEEETGSIYAALGMTKEEAVSQLISKLGQAETFDLFAPIIERSRVTESFTASLLKNSSSTEDSSDQLRPAFFKSCLDQLDQLELGSEISYGDNLISALATIKNTEVYIWTTGGDGCLQFHKVHRPRQTDNTTKRIDLLRYRYKAGFEKLTFHGCPDPIRGIKVYPVTDPAGESVQTIDMLRLLFADLQAPTLFGLGLVGEIRLIDKLSLLHDEDHRIKNYDWFRKKLFLPVDKEQGSYPNPLLGAIRTFPVKKSQLDRLLLILKKHQLKTAYAWAKTLTDSEQEGIKRNESFHIYQILNKEADVNRINSLPEPQRNKEIQRLKKESTLVMAHATTLLQVLKSGQKEVNINNIEPTPALLYRSSTLLLVIRRVFIYALENLIKRDLFTSDMKKEYISYSFTGSTWTLFGSSQDAKSGINCAEWCKRLLYEIGLDNQVKNKNTPIGINFSPCIVS